MPDTAPSRSVKYTGRNVRGRLTIPSHAHPLVRRLFEELNAQQTTIEELALRMNGSPRNGPIAPGVDTIRFWATRHMPRLDTFEAAVNVLDLELVLRKRRMKWRKA